MKRKTYQDEESGHKEKMITIGCIVSGPLLDQMCSNPTFFKDEYICSDSLASVISMCMDYYDEYHEPPNKMIQKLYEDEQAEDEEFDTDNNIAKFLDRCSYEWTREMDTERHNDGYFVQTAYNYFIERRMAVVHELKGQLIEQKAEADAINEVDYTFPMPDLNLEDKRNPYRDDDYLSEVLFDDDVEPLFRLPGELGELWNPFFVRSGFFGLLAPEKRGKSWNLLYMAKQAAKAGRNVLFITAGDMTRKDVYRRSIIMDCKRSNRERYCGAHWQPVIDCKHNQEGTCPYWEEGAFPSTLKATDDDDKEYIIKDPEDVNVPHDYEVCPDAKKKGKDACPECKKAIWFKKVGATRPIACDKETKKQMKQFDFHVRKRGFEVEYVPRGRLTTPMIQAMIRRLEREGTIVDVVVIDYADIMAPEPGSGSREERHIHTARWGALRRLAQEQHCLVITATQATREGGQQTLLNEQHVSEAKTKTAEVTVFTALNQTPAEKLLGIMRYNIWAAREEDFHIRDCVFVLQNLKRGIVHLDSYREFYNG